MSTASLAVAFTEPVAERIARRIAVGVSYAQPDSLAPPGQSRRAPRSSAMTALAAS